MKKLKLAIIHFQALELYPPITNLINLLDQKNDVDCVIYSTKSKLATYLFSAKNKYISIKRIGQNGQKVKKLVRYWNYFSFNFIVLLKLIARKNSTIIYYETISCWPAVMYKKYFNKKVHIYTHYHEYNSKNEYENGMLLIKKMHKLERENYNLFKWISHTNQYRMDLFTEDNPLVKDNLKRVMPNFPPFDWLVEPKVNSTSIKKFVLVGALGLDDLYLKEIINWIEAQNGKATLDMYCININEDVKKYLKSQNLKYCKVLPGVSYYELNKVLCNYDIGLILYKGITLNYIYNAPNKLFEYLLCGLQVWFPVEMIGCYEYQSDVLPKVLKIDFKNLENIDFNCDDFGINKKNDLHKYTYEVAYRPLLNSLSTKQ